MIINSIDKLYHKDKSQKANLFFTVVYNFVILLSMKTAMPILDVFKANKRALLGCAIVSAAWLCAVAVWTHEKDNQRIIQQNAQILNKNTELVQVFKR